MPLGLDKIARLNEGRELHDQELASPSAERVLKRMRSSARLFQILSMHCCETYHCLGQIGMDDMKEIDRMLAKMSGKQKKDYLRLLISQRTSSVTKNKEHYRFILKGHSLCVKALAAVYRVSTRDIYALIPGHKL